MSNSSCILTSPLMVHATAERSSAPRCCLADDRRPWWTGRAEDAQEGLRPSHSTNERRAALGPPFRFADPRRLLNQSAARWRRLDLGRKPIRPRQDCVHKHRTAFAMGERNARSAHPGAVQVRQSQLGKVQRIPVTTSTREACVRRCAPTCDSDGFVREINSTAQTASLFLDRDQFFKRKLKRTEYGGILFFGRQVCVFLTSPHLTDRLTKDQDYEARSCDHVRDRTFRHG